VFKRTAGGRRYHADLWSKVVHRSQAAAGAGITFQQLASAVAGEVLPLAATDAEGGMAAAAVAQLEEDWDM
jgi:hypothetical protein